MAASLFHTHPAEPNAIELADDSAITEYAEMQAGCGGRVFLNVMTGELWLTDAPGLILWRSFAMVQKEWPKGER